MVKDGQVRILMRLMHREKTLATAAAKAGMTEKTARKYRDLGQLPSQGGVLHDWKTREDAFASDWPWVEELLQNNAGLEAKTLFAALQREEPGRYQDGQLRTFQRRVKRWRALAGPGKEIFFAQVYRPGEWCESDFTHMGDLGVTIGGVPFAHLLYHFVLCWSNWETGTVCFSESYESLSLGLQNALWKLGGVASYHRTDNLTSAVNRIGNPETFSTCDVIVQQLLRAKRALELDKLLKKLSKYDALMIDDFGYVKQDRDEMEVLFTLLAYRYERGSVLLTSNLPFSKWEMIFKDPMTTAAAIDRLIHHSVVLELNVPSYRAEEAKKRKDKDNQSPESGPL